MNVESLLQIVTMLMAAVSVSGGAMRSSQLAQEFPKRFDDGNASVEQVFVEHVDYEAVAGLPGPLVVTSPIDVVTLTDGGSFCDLFDLKFELPIAGKPRLPWCRYEGFDGDYHYAQCIRDPREIYRVPRAKVDAEHLGRKMVERKGRGREGEGTSVSIPVSTAASLYLRRANLDRSLIPIPPLELDVPQ